MTCTACELSPHTVGATEVRDDVAHYAATHIKAKAAYLRGAGAVALLGPDCLVVYGDKLVPYVMHALQELKSIGGDFELLDHTGIEPADLNEAAKDALANGAVESRHEAKNGEQHGAAPSLN